LKPRGLKPRGRIKIRRWYTKPVETGCRSARPPLQPASAGFCVSAAGFIPRDIRARLRIILRARIKIRRWYTKPVKTGCRSARPPLQPASAGFCVSAAGFIPRDTIPRDIIPRATIPRAIIPRARIKIRRWYTKPVKTGYRSALQPASAGFCVSAAGFIPRGIRARLRIIPRYKNDQEAHYDVLA